MAASWRRAVWFPKEDGAGQNQTPHPSLAIVGLNYSVESLCSIFMDFLGTPHVRIIIPNKL